MMELQQKLARRRTLNGEVDHEAITSQSIKNQPVISYAPNKSEEKEPASHVGIQEGNSSTSELQKKLARGTEFNGEDKNEMKSSPTIVRSITPLKESKESTKFNQPPITHPSNDIQRNKEVMKNSHLSSLQNELRDQKAECRRLAEKGRLVDELEKQRIQAIRQGEKCQEQLETIKKELTEAKELNLQTNAVAKDVIPSSIGDFGRSRFALLIGNQNYKQAAAMLKSPISDVTELAARLRATCHFDHIMVVTDANYDQMVDAAKRFGTMINHPSVLERGRVAFFYYSGHGGTEKGRQILYPIESNSYLGLGTKKYFSVGDDLIPHLKPSKSNAPNKSERQLQQENSSIMIFDACRVGDDPMNFSLPNLPNSLIAVAYSSNECAYDLHPNNKDYIEGHNSAYTTAFLNTLLSHPEISIHQLFIRVSHVVNHCVKQGHLSAPQFTCNLNGDFMFQYGRIRGKFEDMRNEVIQEAVASGRTSTTNGSYLDLVKFATSVINRRNPFSW